MDQESQHTTHLHVVSVIEDLECELASLIELVKKLTYSKTLKLRGELSLGCERVERLLRLLETAPLTAASSEAGISVSTRDYIRVEAHALLARARTLAATSLRVGEREGNVVHLARDEAKAEHDAYEHMLAALEIDLLLESPEEQAVAETTSPLRLVYSRD